MVEHHNHPNYDNRIGELRSDLQRLDHRLSSVQSDVAGVRSSVSALSGRLSSTESEIEGISSDLTRLEQFLSSYEELIQDIAGSLGAANDELQAVAEQLEEESERERVHRERVDAALDAIHAAQRQLSEVLHGGFEQAKSKLEDLHEQQKGFQKQFVQTGEDFEDLLRKFDSALRSQIGGIEEEVVTLEDDEREAVGQTLESLDAIRDRHDRLRERFESIERSSSDLKEHLAQLVWHQQQHATWAAQSRATSDNAAGLKLLARGQTVEAIEQFRRAAVQTPDKLAPRFNLAAALLNYGNLDEASQVSGSLLDDFPNHSEVRLLTATIALRRGRIEIIVDLLKPCSEAQKEPRILCGLGIGYLAAGRPEAARRWLRQAAGGSDETAAALQTLPAGLLEPLNDE